MTQAAHRFKRIVQIIRQDSDPSHFPGWKAVAFGRFTSGILERFSIPCQVLHNDDIALIVDHKMIPIAALDVDTASNHYVLLPFPNASDSPLIQKIVTAINTFASEISDGPTWQ